MNSLGHHGYLPVNDVAGNDAFYMYVENQAANKNAPLLIITPNGTGKSVLSAYFTSWGQDILRLTKNTLRKNHAAFNQYADLLLVDIPIGTGFSRYSNPSQIPKTPKQKVSHFK